MRSAASPSSRARRPDRRRRLGRRLAGDPARGRAARTSSDAARGDGGSARSSSAVAAELPEREVVCGRAEEQATDRLRRRRVAHALAPPPVAARVVPAARSAGRRGGALARRPTADLEQLGRGWPEQLGWRPVPEERAGLLVVPEDRADAGAVSRAARAWPGNVLSPEYYRRRARAHPRASPTRRAASARRRPPSTSPPASRRPASACSLVDLDPQANATSGLGEQANGDVELRPPRRRAVLGVAKPTRFENLDLVPSKPDARRDRGRARAARRRRALPRASARACAREAYAFVFVDCPPSLGPLTVNALAAADRVLVPVQCEYYALEGLSQLLELDRAAPLAAEPGASRSRACC